jgi:hypothetical protein
MTVMNGVYRKMIRLLFNFIVKLFFGTHWSFPQFVVRPTRLLYDKGLTMATAIVGRQGIGKTWALAVELWQLMKAYPEQSFIIFDWSGGLIFFLMLLILSDPESWKLLPRLVFDGMGGRKINGKTYVMRMPFFSEAHDPEKPWLERVEDQADRVQRVFEALNEELIKRNPTMGGRPIKGLLVNLLLLVNAIEDKNGENWQITEVTRLLNKEFRELALRQFGHKVKKANEYFKHKVKKANEYFKNSFTGDTKLDKDMANALADVLDVLKSQRVRARVGGGPPGWTYQEADRKGLIVFCDGSELNNNHNQKALLYLQLLFQFSDFLNKRPASRSGYPPINLVIDEGFDFNEMPSVGSLLAHFPSEYRSRKLHFFLVIQSLRQLVSEKNGKKGLEEVFFSFGNLIVFSMLDIRDCFTMAENLFPFDAQMVKVPAARDGQHDIMKNRDEQLAEQAYQLQRLAQRECYVRRFIDEARMDKIIHIGRTRDVRITAKEEDVENLKDKLMLARGALLSEAEKIIGQRDMATTQGKGQQPQKVQRKPRGV